MSESYCFEHCVCFTETVKSGITAYEYHNIWQTESTPIKHSKIFNYLILQCFEDFLSHVKQIK